MSQPDPAESVPRKTMMQYLHDDRREEVFTRFLKEFNKVNPVDPALAKPWEEVCRMAFDAAYDFYDLAGERNAKAYNRGRDNTIEAMMDHRLFPNRFLAEQKFMRMQDIARKETKKVHSSPEAKEKLQLVPNRKVKLPPRPPGPTPQHDPMVGTVPPSRPFVEEVIKTPQEKPLALTHQPTTRKEDELATRTWDFFTENNRGFWRHNALARMLNQAYQNASVGPDDVALVLYEGLKEHGIPVTYVPKADEYTASPAEVREFLETHDLVMAATHVWLLEQFEDGYAALAAQVAEELGIIPGKLKDGTAKFEEEFQELLTDFRNKLVEKQKKIMGSQNGAEFELDLLKLEGSLGRSMKAYLKQGPNVGARATGRG